MTIAEFLLARIAEDEAAARAATRLSWDAVRDGSRWCVLGGEPGEVVPIATAEDFDWNERGWQNPDGIDHNNALHIARHDPARVLAECEAKRRIIAIHEPDNMDLETLPDWCVVCSDPYGETVDYPCDTVRALALPYADHPDYREEWRP